MSRSEKISVRGAREHNLRSVNIDLPRNKLIVITGLSGSGKSSLAFDTIFAEGQRRYVESLSAYARQFLEQMDKPDVDSIEGLSPAVSIEQKTVSKNPRSTVGTVTEIYDYLRLLFARIGRPYCYQCGKPIQAQTVQEIVDRIMAFPDKSRVVILAPLVTNRKGEHKKILEQLQREGFVRVRINGEIQELSSSVTLDKNKKHTIEAVVDRLVVHAKMKNRLTDSVELGLHLSGGSLVAWHNMEHEFFFSENAACHECGISYPELSPQMFSFNSPLGACPKCDGLGTLTEFDPDRIVPDKTKTLREGAIAPWANRLTSFFQQRLTALVRNYGCDKDTPFEELPQNLQKIILYGTDGLSAVSEFQKEGSNYSFGRFFEGVVNFLKRRYQETESFSRRQEIERYMTVLPCPECSGARLRKESLSIRVGGHTIAELTASTVEQASELFTALPLDKQEQKIARRILKEIQDRLNFLVNVGLNYLTLNRSSTTLSGG